jgi:hypothetical protein
MAKAKPIIVTVSDAGMKDIHAIADRLAARGMTVSRVLTHTGTITGSSAAGKVASLEKVEGVLSVADDTYVELPPTGSKPQ